MTLLRSVLYVPGSNPRAMAKAPSLGADALLLDLEDSVAPEAKASAREHVAALLTTPPLAQPMAVRINALASRWWQEDLLRLAPLSPLAICIPKVEREEELRPVIRMLEKLEQNYASPVPLTLWPMIETPLGVLNAYSIASHPRVTALVAGVNDLAKGLRLRMEGNRQPLHHALQQIILCARGADRLVLDGVYGQVGNDAGCAAECAEGARLGFDGKTLIHPSQVPMANRAFLPGEEEITRARRIIHGWQAASARGEEVCLVDGELVERLHAQQAERLLTLWEQAQPASG